VTPDLADRCDDVLAHLLRDARQLVLTQAVQVLRTLDPVKQSVWLRCAHEVRV
jgi:hypothetical protein